MRRVDVAGLALLVALALFTLWHQGVYSDDRRLWDRGQTIRAHVNARDAALGAGDSLGALAECHWLLYALETGEPEQPTPVQARDIPRLCLRAPVSASSR